MHTKQSLADLYRYFEMVHSVTYRLVEQFSDAQLAFRPAPGVRSAQELIVHIFSEHVTHTAAVLTGKLPQGASDALAAEGMSKKTVKELVAWCKSCFAKAKDNLGKTTDAQLAAPVEAWYGTFDGGTMVAFCYDEHWHHRGQLTVYLRLLGITPVFLYDYGAH